MLLTDLHLAIIPEGVQWTISGARDSNRSAVCRASALPLQPPTIMDLLVTVEFLRGKFSPKYAWERKC